MKYHSQFNLPTFAEAQKLKPIVPDFELRQANILKTAKDLVIKSVFKVDNSETAFFKGQRIGRTTFTGANYTASTSDYLIAVTDLVLAPTVGLPLPSLVGTGKIYAVKDEVGGASTTTVTIRADGEKLIDGSTSATLSVDYQCKSFYTDGTEWFTKTNT